MLSFPSSSVHGGDTSLHRVGKIFIDMAGIQNCFLASVPKGSTATVELQGRRPGLAVFAWRAQSWDTKLWNGKRGMHRNPGELRFSVWKASHRSMLWISFNSHGKQNGMYNPHSHFSRRKLRFRGQGGRSHLVAEWRLWPDLKLWDPGPLHWPVVVRVWTESIQLPYLVMNAGNSPSPWFEACVPFKSQYINAFMSSVNLVWVLRG